MQYRLRSIGRLARLGTLVWLLAAGVPALAQEASANADAPAEVPPPAPIDTSKHGTVEAEIPAQAESESPPPTRELLKHRLIDKRWDRGGYFLGLGGHYAVENTDRITDTAHGGGVQIRVGLKHNRFWQTEFSSLYFSKFKDDTNDFWGWGVHLGERFYLTKTRLQPYIGAHVGFIQTRGTFHGGGRIGFTPKFNAGLNLYTTPTFNWELDFAYYYGIGATQDYDFATATFGFTWF